MMSNALLAFGIVLTTASQLRLPGVPLGVGEICLVLWLGLILLRQLTGGRVFNERALLLVGLFWALFAFAMSVGTCVALLSNELDLDTMLHDAIAYLLVAAITCSIAATMEADRALRQTLWLLLAFWNVALVLQISAGWGLIGLPSVDPWYWDRFRGWSENPNQLALNCAILTPLSLHLALSSKGLGRVAGLFSCLLSHHRRPADQERYVPDCDDGCHRALSDTAGAELVELARAQIQFAICDRRAGCRRDRSTLTFVSAICCGNGYRR